MTTPSEVIELVERFRRNIDTYKRAEYNEAQVRVEFIAPFFEALGWDVRNVRGYAEQYKDVIHEAALKIGGATRAPDYSFRIGGMRKFFLEAKKPSVSVKEGVGPAYQLRRYAWSAKLPLSVLTNFEEFAVYDCRQRPSPDDKASLGRIMYLTFEDYPERFGEIYDVFSKESVLNGSFDQYIQTAKVKRGTGEVDAEFLKEIEKWRDELARNIALRNPSLSVDEMNYAVQSTIDRIIFLRICEDRGIEEYGRLLSLSNGSNIYARTQELYHQAEQKYNSGIFDFKADALTTSLSIDDKVLKSLFGELYYPDSPYEFSVLPAAILGQVYEQFLGKVIRLTESHRAKVEEKPEVKKAGGVYYTPSYIVDYIVEQTIGPLFEGKTPRQIAARRILDPACGSGSFLLGAYQYLLDCHLRWYEANEPEKHARGKRPTVYQGPGSVWRLTTAEKKRILLSNIFGVDIDRQAVEVTKLSLLLKVLEDESDETLTQQMSLFQEQALPNLDSNIKCGNSLVGPEFFSGQLLPDTDELRRINPFDWTREFPGAMNAGGFDCIIGNPPYIRIQTMKEWAPKEVELYKQIFSAARAGNYDIYVVFVEKGLSLLNRTGRLGFIMPHKFFNAQYGESLRSLLAKGKHLSQVVHFGDQQVFAGATTYTCLLFLDKAGSDEFRFIKVADLSTWRASGEAAEGTIPAVNLTTNGWNFAIGRDAALFERLNRIPIRLADVAHLFVGLQTDADDVFILEEVRRDNERVLCESKSTGRQHWLENEHLKPFLKGSLNIRRYCLANVTKRLIFPYETREGKSVLIDAKDYGRRYPLTWKYLEENRERLAARDKGRMGQEWYAYVYKKNHTLFGNPKLVVPSIATGSCFAADLSGTYYFVGSGGGGGGGYGVTLSIGTQLSYLYLLGLLNSHLLSAYLKMVSTPFRGGYIALNRQYIEQLPIRTINFSDPTDVTRHDAMAKLVEQMLELHKRLASASIPADKTLCQRQIDATDQQIDGFVYELYGLTVEEIRIVEESTR
jgi:type I restriction-modification system DNA methylase subunit